MARVKQLLFVDTNIWLDFYRARTDAGLSLLHHLDAIADKLIATHVLEMEVKKNRQRAILEGMKALQAPPQIARLGLFSDAKAVKKVQRSIRDAESRIKSLRTRLAKAITKPAQHDPVYKVYQRIFHGTSDLVLRSEDKKYFSVHRKAVRRFYMGCPPRKSNDTSIGDAINWEWMIACAIEHNAELVIVSRDSDYGIDYDGTAHLNDHLKQDFSERVSKKRKVLLYRRLSEALKHFAVPVTQAEVQEEDFLLHPQTDSDSARDREALEALLTLLREAAHPAHQRLKLEEYAWLFDEKTVRAAAAELASASADSQALESEQEETADRTEAIPRG